MVIDFEPPIPAVELSDWAARKYERGCQRLDDLTRKMMDWSKRDANTIEYRLRPDRQHVDVIARVGEPPPVEEFSLDLGEAVHDIRGALDALCWELCTLDGAVPADPLRVMFPMLSDETKWPRQAQLLATMPDVFRERVRLVQPYIGNRPEGLVGALSALSMMSNYDKHRGMLKAIPELNLNGTLSISFDRTTAPDPAIEIKPEDMKIDFHDAIYADGNVLFTYTFGAPLLSAGGNDDQVALGWQVEVAPLGGKAPWQGILEAMQQIGATIHFIRTGEGPFPYQGPDERAAAATPA